MPSIDKAAAVLGLQTAKRLGVIESEVKKLREPLSATVKRAVSDAIDGLLPSLPSKKDLRDEVAAQKPYIAQLVERAVSAIPKPKDGKDADPELVLRAAKWFAADFVRAIPVPKDGKDADPAQIRIMVETAVAEAVSRIPKAKDGQPGKAPRHEWMGTALRFRQPTGKWGKLVDLQGPPGPAVVHARGGGGSGGAGTSDSYTKAQSDARFEPIGEAATEVAAHDADAGAHTGLFDPAGTAATEVSDHVAESDPHAQYQKESEKGVANGYAGLDSGGKVPVAQLPNAIMEYRGTWNASTNTPTLVDGTDNDPEDAGNVYRVTVAGTQDLGSGSISFAVGDYAILNSSLIWEKADATDAVASVHGRTGAVVAAASDYDASQVDNDSGVAGSKVSDALDTLDSGKQPLDSDLTAIAALTTAAFGRGLLEGSTFTAVQQLLGVRVAAVTSDVTTTQDTPQSITGLSFPIAANERWAIFCYYRTSCSGSGGIKYAINGPTSTTLIMHAQGPTTSSTAELVGTVTLDGLTAALNTVASGRSLFMGASVLADSTPGTIQMRFASTTSGQTSTILAGSYMFAIRIA